MPSVLQCMDCGQQYPLNQVIYACDTCGGLLDVTHDWTTTRTQLTRDLFDSRLGTRKKPYNSGVWRFKELIYPDVDDTHIVSRPEGNTNLYELEQLSEYAGVDTLYLKHEGENPTGSFKDRGMTGGVTHAKAIGMKRVACASTGNTSSSLASYAALGGLQGIIFLPNKQIALGKLAQGVAFGAVCIQTDGDFDENLALVREVSERLQVYVLNSINPFRLEGQKSIMFELLQQLEWSVPDWIVCPGGNLGNSSAFGKGLKEIYDLGLIDKMPRLAIIQAEGASPLYQAYCNGFTHYEPMKAHTLATAIKIGNPVSYKRAVRALKWTNGVVESVTDQEIMDAKALIDRSGIGCEPASAATLAGTRKLVASGIIKPYETVAGILTGHVLKDTDTIIAYHNHRLDGITPTMQNRMLQADATAEGIMRVLEGITEPEMA
jgi:threonine synthase